MKKTLRQLCEDIEAGYAAGLCMMDHPLCEHIEQLSNMTEEIKALCADHKMVLVISGGNLQTVHVSKGFPTIDLMLVDHDNLDSCDVDSDTIESREIADCPNVIIPDIPEEQTR